MKTIRILIDQHQRYNIMCFYFFCIRIYFCTKKAIIKSVIIPVCESEFYSCIIKTKIDVEKSGSRYIIPSFMSIFPVMLVLERL